MVDSKKKNNKSIETVPKKDLTADILDKDFITTVLQMLEELKEDVQRVKKIIHKRNGTISEETENSGKK